MSGIHTQIEEARKDAMPWASTIKTFRQYARGRQRGTLTAAQQRILRSLLGNRFSDNVCAMVLEQLSNRLILARFEVEGAASVEQWLRTWWTLNHMPTLSAQVHYAMLRDAVSAVSLGWNGERVVTERERWWNGTDGVFIFYDGSEPTWAVKEWKTKQGRRRTVWYPDHIERFIGVDGGWRAYRLPTDPQEGPIYWQDQARQPLGLPVVMFANVQTPADADDDASKDGDPIYGASELDGGLLGLQDEINDIHRDITAAARFTGYQMMYATGVQPEQDDAGEEIPLRVEPGAVFQSQNADAKYGVLPPGSMAELERTLNIKLGAVSRRSSVPMHLFGGEWPSGEALIRAERPLIDKTENIGRFTGPGWASVAHKSARIANAYGQAGLDEAALITSVFMPAEGRDPITQAAIANARADYVSQREVLRLYGYSPERIDQIMAERAQEREQLGPIERVGLQRAQEALNRDRGGAGANGSIADRLAAAGVQAGAQ